jgi:hypothetical protein
MRIRGREADTAFSREVLPALLCYRSGQLIGNWMRVHEEILGDGIGDDAILDEDVVDHFLTRHNVISPTDQAIDITKIQWSIGAIRSGQLYKDDDDDDI